LKSGKLGGAGLDVLSVEPPPPNHPLMQLQHPNLMITPHTAWATLEARKRLLEEVVANIHAFLDGKERNLVA
jgi:glycerate dehydrogenase